MKQRMKLLLVVFLMIVCSGTAWAKSDKQIHEEARFLADKVAHEMELNQGQFLDVYEINYDFLHAVYPLMDRIMAGDEKAITEYYIHLDIRNSDLVWVIAGSKYPSYMKNDALFRPLYVKDGEVRLRVYEAYGNKYFHKWKIKKFGKYNGEHSRSNQNSISYYRGRHRMIAYGGQPRLLHDRNKGLFARARRADFGEKTPRAEETNSF